jgi:hypothetical protein
MTDTRQTMDAARIKNLFKSDERDAGEILRLVELMNLFIEAPCPDDPFGLYPNYPKLKEQFAAALTGHDPDRIEQAFLELYCHLHGHEAPYTQIERARVNQTGGYWCHAGGISPVLKAAPYIHAHTVTADFGAGNGLQGLLFQKLYPHKKTIQFEISSKMVEAGKVLQQWLGIPADRVEWVVGDVMDSSPAGIDFIYLYRPLKPVGPGRVFYQQFAKQLAQSNRDIVIFSIADCLKDFLPDSFRVFYSDGHLTCFLRSLEEKGANRV